MSNAPKHDIYLEKALQLAQRAAEEGEVPVGALIVDAQGQVVGEGYNRKEGLNDVSSHAEIEAIRSAAQHLGDWRLNDCTLYTTLEPCPMCAGAILHARLDAVVYGAHDRKWGAAGTRIDLFESGLFNHHLTPTFHHFRACEEILTSFFQSLRGQ